MSDLTSPVEIFRHDTYPPTDSGSDDEMPNGAWMVYPFGDQVYVSSRSQTFEHGGVYVFVK